MGNRACRRRCATLRVYVCLRWFGQVSRSQPRQWCNSGRILQRAGDRWVALAAAVLAALEYVNYYHRQLQHFDNFADIKRLLTGRGFRRSQMARDLERYS